MADAPTSRANFSLSITKPPFALGSTDNVVPVLLRPFPPTIVEAALVNCVNVIASEPILVVPVLMHTKPWPCWPPSSTKQNAPLISELALKSSVRVHEPPSTTK